MAWPLFRYILKAAVRDRLFLSLVGILILVCCLSIFFGASVITEQDQFVRSFASFGSRLFGVVSLVLFVVTSIRRSFESRDIDYLLSRPIGRVSFILTHAAGFSCLALLASLILGGALVALQTGDIHSGVLFWWLTLTVEFVIMANVAMFFSFVVTSSSVCMIMVFAFYLLSRLIGEILGILQKGAESGVILALSKVMELISIFIPRLDLMAQSKWLLYGVSPDLSVPFVLAQGAVFLSIVIGASVIDMHRRQF